MQCFDDLNLNLRGDICTSDKSTCITKCDAFFFNSSNNTCTLFSTCLDNNPSSTRTESTEQNSGDMYYRTKSATKSENSEIASTISLFAALKSSLIN